MEGRPPEAHAWPQGFTQRALLSKATHPAGEASHEWAPVVELALSSPQSLLLPQSPWLSAVWGHTAGLPAALGSPTSQLTVQEAAVLTLWAWMWGRVLSSSLLRLNFM